jgi:hypothetical protein
MQPSFKDLTNFFIDIGADTVSHTEKTYLAHAIGVYNDLKKWGFDEEFARIGLFHSIYGTELFQGFTLPLERRDEIRGLIGERAEYLSYLNCCMDRASYDTQVVRREAPYTIIDRFNGEQIELDEKTFNDLVNVHLCDWLEQVERWGNWDYRRDAFASMAERLGGIGAESYTQVFGREPKAG